MEVTVSGMTVVLNEADIMELLKDVAEIQRRGLDRSEIVSMKIHKKEDGKFLQIELKPLE